MKTFSVCFLALTATLVSSQTFHWGPCPTPPVQQNFDPSQYLGTWYEIEKLPASFEMGTCIEANYSLRPDNSIKVLNSQIYEGKVVSLEGTAVVLDPKEPAKLGVTFFPSQPSSPYWVLSTDYKTSVVYSCTDFGAFHVDFAWILARTRTLPLETVNGAKDIFIKENIDISQMSPTDQSNCDTEL